MQKVVSLFQWEVHTYFWGTAVKERRTGKWVAAFLSPGGQEINLEGLNVEIHENGVEFLDGEDNTDDDDKAE
ncbi:MAG: hypothetical protein PUB49_05055 [Selenomonadaceae bacterium]|nr:hypothetical protein [Selenomonadaceae bacterium]